MIGHYEAKHILDRALGRNDAHWPDFDVLSRAQVWHLLSYADDHGYRAPRGANGSRGRYWYAYLQRRAAVTPRGTR